MIIPLATGSYVRTHSTVNVGPIVWGRIWICSPVELIDTSIGCLSFYRLFVA
jgi:hypothetical protein